MSKSQDRSNELTIWMGLFLTTIGGGIAGYMAATWAGHSPNWPVVALSGLVFALAYLFLVGPEIRRKLIKRTPRRSIGK